VIEAPPGYRVVTTVAEIVLAPEAESPFFDDRLVRHVVGPNPALRCPCCWARKCPWCRRADEVVRVWDFPNGAWSFNCRRCSKGWIEREEVT
jgi:hypothetical protein